MPITPMEIKLAIGGAIAIFIMGLLLMISQLSSAYHDQKDKTAAAVVTGQIEHAGASASAGAGAAASETSEKIVHTYEETNHYIKSIESAPDIDGVVSSWSAGIDGLRAQAAAASATAQGDGIQGGTPAVSASGKAGPGGDQVN